MGLNKVAQGGKRRKRFSARVLVRPHAAGRLRLEDDGDVSDGGVEPIIPRCPGRLVVNSVPHALAPAALHSGDSECSDDSFAEAFTEMRSSTATGVASVTHSYSVRPPSPPAGEREDDVEEEEEEEEEGEEADEPRSSSSSPCRRLKCG